MYVDGICVINVFIYSWIQSPIFTSFAQQKLPAPLCASRPTFSSEDLFTSVSETCMHHGAIRCCYLISFRTKMNRGVSSWNISICFDYNIKVLWLTSNRCWADVGGRHQPNVEATLGQYRTADIDPTSAQHMFPCSFFHSIICQNYFAPKLSQCWKQRSLVVQFLAWLQTYCTLTWNLIHINSLRPRQNDLHFSRRHFQMHFLECKYMNFD